MGWDNYNAYELIGLFDTYNIRINDMKYLTYLYHHHTNDIVNFDGLYIPQDQV